MRSRRTSGLFQDTQRLLLTGDVMVQITGWTFEAQQAVVWINRVPSEKGS